MTPVIDPNTMQSTITVHTVRSTVHGLNLLIMFHKADTKVNADLTRNEFLQKLQTKWMSERNALF